MEGRMNRCNIYYNRRNSFEKNCMNRKQSLVNRTANTAVQSVRENRSSRGEGEHLILLEQQPKRYCTSSSAERVQKDGAESSMMFDMKKWLLLVVVSALLLFAGCSLFSGLFPAGSSVVEANQPLSDIQYKVIEIQKGDSLWSIAKENMNPGFNDIYEYMNEVKRCNQLDSDRITAGNYLMIPYYEAGELQ